jgi:hypothetical protein
MKKTLQDQYLLIKEGKGHKGVFLADAKRQFPNIVRNAATFEEASSCLKTKNIISENVIGLTAVNSPFEPKKKESYELAFENFLAEAKKKKEEDEKAELKATSKQVEKDLEHNFDYKDDKNPDNLIFDQIMTGYYTEMKDPKNADKTMQELKDMVFKNLQKDPIFYTKDGQFGVKDLGYSVDHPGLGEPKEPKGKYKASGYGDLKEGKDINIKGKTIKNAKQNDDKSYTVTYVDDTTDRIAVSNNNWDDINDKYGDLNEGIHDRDILSRPLSNPDYEPFERSPEELGNDADNRSKNILRMKYSQQINDPTISDEDLRYILGGKGVKGFGGRSNAIDKIIKDRNKGNKIEDIDSLEREARITLSSKGYSPFSLRSYSRQELIDLANKSEFTENKSLEESKLRKVIREMIDAELSVLPKTSLKESVEKELAAINKEAEHEIIASKLEKVQTLIDKKQAQISRLDEDEDLKDLTDAKKVKEISKDIKSLEKAKSKLEKMMHKGKAKSPRKEVIDETDEIIDETELNEAPPSEDITTIGTNLKKTSPELKKFEDTLTNISKIELEEEDETILPQNILNQVVEKFAAMSGDRDSIPLIASSFPDYKKKIIEFLDGYDLGLDYDI